MELKIIAPGGNEMKVIASLPQTFNGHKLLNASAITGVAKFGEITFQNYIGDGFNIWYSNYNIAEPTTLIGRADTPVLEFHIQFLNQFSTEWDGIGEAIMKQYRYNISFVPFVNNKASFQAGRSCHTFDIHFTIPYLQRLAKEFPTLDKFLQKVIKEQACSISDVDRYLTPEMVTIVNQILKCHFRNCVAAYYIECKVLELLLLALEEVSGKHPLAPIRLSAYDIERLNEAKQLIVQDFEKPLTLMQLSRKVAINDYKLKKGFKYLFGITIFKYMHTIRMEKAKAMILETDMLLEDIAVT